MRGHLDLMRQYDLAAADLRCLCEALADSQVPPARHPPTPLVFTATVTEPWPAHGEVGRTMWRPGLDQSALTSIEDRTSALLSAMGGAAQAGAREMLPRGPLQGAVLAAAAPRAHVEVGAPHGPRSLVMGDEWMAGFASIPADSGPSLNDTDLAPTTKRRDGPVFEDEPHASYTATGARMGHISARATNCRGSNMGDCSPQRTTRFASVAGGGAEVRRFPGGASVGAKAADHQRRGIAPPAQPLVSVASEVAAFLGTAR